MAKNEVKIKFDAETQGFTDAINEANSEMSTLRAEMKLNEAQFQNTGDSAEYLQTKGELLESQIEANQNKQEALNEKLEIAKQIYGEDSEEVERLQRQLIYAQTEEQKLQAQVNECNDALNGQTQAADSSGSAIDDMAQMLTSLGIAEAVSEIAEAAMEMAEAFDEANAVIVEGTGASGEALEALNNSAKEAFGSIKNADADLNSIAGVLAELNTRFGITGDEATELTTKIANFSQHCDIDGVTAVDNIADVMHKWGIDISDIDSLLDDLTTANQSCQLSTDQLTSYLSENSIQFKELGYSSEEALAMLVSLSDGGQNVSSVMSGMKKAVTNLAEGTNDVPGAFEQCIKTIAQFDNVSDALKAEVGDTGKTIQDVFGAKAAQEICQAVQNGTFAIEDWTEALKNNDGALKNTTENATTMQDAWSQATNNVGLALSGTLAPALSDVVIGVSGIITEIAQAVQESPALQAAIIAIAAALGVLAAALMITSAITAVNKALTILNGTLLANPVVLIVTAIIAAIAALVATIVWAWKNSETFRKVVTTVFNAIKSVVATVTNTIKIVITAVWNGIKTVITTTLNAIKTAISTQFKACEVIITTVFNTIKTSVTGIWDGIRDTIGNAMEAAKEKVRSAIETIKGFFNFVFSWPKIPLPHFSITPSGWKVGDLLKGTIPKLGVEWYAKGGIFDAPTIIPTLAGLKGVGEAGPEAVTPISVLQEYVGEAVRTEMGNNSLNYDLLADKIAKASARLNISVEMDRREVARVVRSVQA